MPWNAPRIPKKPEKIELTDFDRAVDSLMVARHQAGNWISYEDAKRLVLGDSQSDIDRLNNNFGTARPSARRTKKGK